MGNTESAITKLEQPIYPLSLLYFFKSSTVDPTSVIGERTPFKFQENLITEQDSKAGNITGIEVIYLTMGNLNLLLEGTARTVLGSPGIFSRTGDFDYVVKMSFLDSNISTSTKEKIVFETTVDFSYAFDGLSNSSLGKKSIYNFNVKTNAYKFESFG